MLLWICEMRSLLASLIFALAACGGSHADASSTTPPPRPASQAVAAFEPTAFTIEVSGHGRPIIFIPGLGCPGALWRDTVAHLDGYEAHVLTLAGFAGRPAIDGPLAATTRAELARYIRDRKLDHPIIVGHSMGGFIAYWLAAAEPDLVGPTIIVDSGASLANGDPDGDAAAARQARALWRDASDDQFAQQVHDIFPSMTAKPDRLAPMLDAVARSDRRAMGDAIYEQFTTDLRPMLTAIRSPVLVVLADGSLQDGMRAHAAKVRDHTVIVVPGAKHFVMLDDPDRFFSTIDSFLAAHPAPSSPVAGL
jgi:pimeloyl-ACP methyl ester carboxylesterase